MASIQLFNLGSIPPPILPPANNSLASEIVNSEIESVTGKSIAEDVLESAFSRMTADTAVNTKAIMTFANISKDEGFTSKVPEEEDVFNTEFNQ